jgi:hypothetical protein
MVTSRLTDEILGGKIFREKILVTKKIDFFKKNLGNFWSGKKPIR